MCAFNLIDLLIRNVLLGQLLKYATNWYTHYWDMFFSTSFIFQIILFNRSKNLCFIYCIHFACKIDKMSIIIYFNSQLREEIISELPLGYDQEKPLPEFTARLYREQVVAGTNFFVKVSTFRNQLIFMSKTFNFKESKARAHLIL